MHVLSIETCCDETAAAVINLTEAQATVLANVVSSQASLHAQWGGVVPQLAAREHIRNIVPVIEEALTRANLKPQDIDLIAVTQGPGLMPALLIGVSAGKTLAFVWKKPLIGINHLEGHIYANFLNSPTPLLKARQSVLLEQRPRTENSKKIFPLVALIVSGGHTQLVLMRKHFSYTLLGETQDDAAGEAFDKIARLLNLAYPGGPEIAKRADAFCKNILQNSEAKNYKLKTKNFPFPRPMLQSNDFNFSFSGLKTAVLYFLKKHQTRMQDEKFIDEVCYEFQEAIVDTLVSKTKRALKFYKPHALVIAGGVSANVRLREQMRALINRDFPDTQFLTPEFSYSLDNAAMIGAAAAMRFEYMNEKQREKLLSSAPVLDPNANLPLSSI